MSLEGVIAKFWDDQTGGPATGEETKDSLPPPKFLMQKGKSVESRRRKASRLKSRILLQLKNQGPSPSSRRDVVVSICVDFLEEPLCMKGDLDESTVRRDLDIRNASKSVHNLND
jgi:hypothetical protein